ncbi:hypothetical protein BIV57_12510 [Mangrovactinospora gilvigrisea]|uniref:PucR C-terminal helix-turn-helix domain-containing protein n=1 Tax=Mangrovactinospora gilvigrisea TaxID=1428644 RepID=A0A1J7CBV8_9ACTN|nr:helix-turn-helix domain-containing protein [Mangrovactinospora gilvigrisea]OIV37146.1 hypothetical protein BIV57_12510 [Mangrovactinospora gilvigrisea]
MADELQEIVDAAADLLGAPATLEDRDFHLVAYAAHEGPGGRTALDRVREESILAKRSTEEVRRLFEGYGIAAADHPVRIPPDPQQGLLGRLCLPVRWKAVTLGYLWLLDDAVRIGPALAAQAAPLCDRAALLMARQARSRADLGLRLDDLISPQSDVRAHAVDEIDQSGVLARDTTLAVAVLRVAADGAGEAQGPLLNPWRLPRSVLTTSTDQDTVLAVPMRPGARDVTASTAMPTVDRARAMVAERLPRDGRATATGVSVGLFGPCHGLAEVRQGWLRARVAARAAAATDTGGQGLVREWSRLGAERLLWCAPDARLAEAVLTPGTTLLLQREDLARTARAFLDAAGSVKDAALELRVHRQTLYHRLHRIEELTGLDLADGRDRLTLHLALTLGPHVA